MLLADKRDLQNQLKLSVLHIEEKELNLYTNNCNTIGTQAALLAGFAFSALIEVRGETFVEGDDHTWVKSLWFALTAVAMMLEIFALVKSMQLSIWAPGLALRGALKIITHQSTCEPHPSTATPRITVPWARHRTRGGDMYVSNHVRIQSCTYPIMYVSNHVRIQSCTYPIMYVSNHARIQACTYPSMWITITHVWDV